MPGAEAGGLLDASWDRLAGRAPRARAVGRELLRRWSEPHRRYHTPAHLRATLRAVDVLEDEASSPDLVRYAAWFHDAVHTGAAGLDEDRSAGLARDLLPGAGMGPDRAEEVARLVLVTKTHDPDPADADGRVLSDADLSVLAGTPDEYRAYAAAVRAEYRSVPDEAFRAGRSRVLRDLLEAPRIFRTGFGGLHWEAAARANILAELDRSAAGSGF